MKKGTLFLVILCVQSCYLFGNSQVVNAADARPVRALHFVLRGVETTRARSMVDDARAAKFNTIIVQLASGVSFDNSPWIADRSAWTKNDFENWVEYANSKGIEVVPELKLLTHQEKFLGTSSPWLMFNSLTYDPSNYSVYDDVVFPLLDELIASIRPSAIHIGHDEVAGYAPWWWKSRLKAEEQLVPAELYLRDVVTIRNYLEKKSIATWMWGDMLISPKEFKSMHTNGTNGSPDGYGKALRKRIPKDIVICDWHYFDKQENYPSLHAFASEGFSVLGATWKRKSTTERFSAYASEYGAIGMIATTWFHVQQKDWETTDSIISNSGEIFYRYFPDED